MEPFYPSHLIGNLIMVLLIVYLEIKDWRKRRRREATDPVDVGEF